MTITSAGRKLSFEILASQYDGGDGDNDNASYLAVHRSNSDPNYPKRNRKKRKQKKKNKQSMISEEESSVTVFESNCDRYVSGRAAGMSVCSVVVADGLRQRAVSGGGTGEETVTTESAEKEKKMDFSERVGMMNGSVGVGRLESEKSLDWKKLMAQLPNNSLSAEMSPVRYFMEEMCSGNSLQKTTTMGNEIERERVYDTIFRLPWRCELLINVGFFVCFDSFLSLFTIMPTRILMVLWRLIITRQFKKPSASELSDFGCFIVLTCGVALLLGTDISLIYHMIRGQSTIKLYVVFNVLEIFDKLFQNFGGDVLETLFNSADGLASCTPDKNKCWITRYICDLLLAVAVSICHSFILLAQATTLSTCIVAHNNALLALLVSNNFAEIKSNVFKRFSKDNIHNLVYSDSIERFHISAFLMFVLAQNILEAEGPWFKSFLSNALLVYNCEMFIDIMKHSFLAKFNNVKPMAYSEFLEDLCKQTLNVQTTNAKKSLTFVPLPPATVVIRVLTPVYAARLPYSPFPWRFFWIIILSAMTFVMLSSLKVLIGMGLKKHAKWYVNRCQKRKLHSD